MRSDIEVEIRRLPLSGGILAVVTVGTEVYGATGRQALAALTAAAARAASALTARGCLIEAPAIVALGLAVLGLEPAARQAARCGFLGAPVSKP